jgi:hypothetical protein
MDRSAVAGWEGPAAVPGSLRASAEEEGPNIPAPSARRGEVSILPTHHTDVDYDAFPAEDAAFPSTWVALCGLCLGGRRKIQDES